MSTQWAPNKQPISLHWAPSKHPISSLYSTAPAGRASGDRNAGETHKSVKKHNFQAGKIQKVKFPAPKRPLRARHPEQRAEKCKKSNFQLPKGPCGHDTWSTGLEKSKKSIFQVPKGPCGHDIRSTRLEKPFKIGSRQLKMEKCVFMKNWNLYRKNTIKSNFLMKTW